MEAFAHAHDVWESEMRITCRATAAGPVYRIYRSDDAFVAEMHYLIPFIHSSGCDVAIGGSEGDPSAILIVGPLDQEVDEAFQKLIGYVKPS